MYKLKYDCEMEKIAAAHASRCQFKHSDRSARQYSGENIFMASPPGDKAAYAWAGELNQYGVGKENIFTIDIANRPGQVIGHYTQEFCLNAVQSYNAPPPPPSHS
ncbi:unnamed protein product [Strongylus vulgaris]|uniref:SCP domain-containing protein n=1 Tax=Strongylus vulgaris TaxID=40348 RepID=A0A3P7JJE4_STRVU|nr:unnamed protein product [Strongylus vulgaris]